MRNRRRNQGVNPAPDEEAGGQRTSCGALGPTTDAQPEGEYASPMGALGLVGATKGSGRPRMRNQVVNTRLGTQGLTTDAQPAAQPGGESGSR